MFLATVLHTLLGLSENATKLVMGLVRLIVELAFLTATARQRAAPETPTLDPDLQDILRHLPIDVEVATKRLKLIPTLKMYAACPRCSCLYPHLSSAESKLPYPEKCTWRNVEGRACDTRLMQSRLVGDRLEWRAIRRFAFRDPKNYVASLYARQDVEKLLDASGPTQKDVSQDIWDSPFLATFRGQKHLPLFFNGPGRLVFALAIDWFNPFRNLEAKKKWSIGAMYLVCLNLPPELRFRLENVCLVGIIPGPREPSLEQINHFLGPLVDSLLRGWNPGWFIESTGNYPFGRIVRVVLGLLVADLLGARHAAGFTFPGHTLFCSYCKLTKGCIDDFDVDQWPKRDLESHRNWARAWEDASSTVERDKITKEEGLRNSALNRLPYFNPFVSLIIDVLHIWLTVCAKHARGAWHMNVTAEAGDGSYDPFHQPPGVITMAKAEHAMLTKSKSEVGKLGKPVVTELCLRRGIRTGGLTKKRLLHELHEWVGRERRTQSACSS